MDNQQFLDLLKQAASLNSDLLKSNALEVECGQWLNSIVLRLHKKRWANEPLTQPQMGRTAIFFSIWFNNSSNSKKQFFYNIHALKLRDLKGYKLTSRRFADEFRQQFKGIESQWPNVSTKYGPLTLMEGWQHIVTDNLLNDVSGLVYKFIELADIIDVLLNDKKT